MKLLILSLALVLAILQYELWFSDNGIRYYLSLKKAINAQQNENKQLALKNDIIAFEVNNLKHNKEALEDHARNDLNLIKPDETFYQLVKPLEKHT